MTTEKILKLISEAEELMVELESVGDGLTDIEYTEIDDALIHMQDIIEETIMGEGF